MARRLLLAATASLLFLVLAAGPALACGGLVSPNGTIALVRTTTLAAYHHGVEHYVTGFKFVGGGAEFGSIVPLPGIPTRVIRGGDWTLQRLEREVQPPVEGVALKAAAPVPAASPAQVILQTSIDSLDITVLKGGGYAVGPIYDLNQNVFGQVNQLIEPTDKVGNDTRVFNGVDVTFNVRGTHGFAFSGGTSTGKVVNDFCDIRAKAPEATIAGAIPINLLLTPYCHQESPFQTQFRGLATYMIPHIDLVLSTVYQDKTNVGTDQLVSLPANYTMTAPDLAAAAAQLGRPLTAVTSPTINLTGPGTLYGDRVRQLDLSAKKIIRISSRRVTVGVDLYNLLNNNVTLAFNQAFSATSTGWLTPTTYMNPRVVRLNAEFAW